MLQRIQNCKLIYGTHKRDIGIKFGLRYGFIDTANGYNNATLINKYMCEEKIDPVIITKFAPSDFDNGIEKCVEIYLEELGRTPDIILLHSPFKINNGNIFAFQKLKDIFPDKIIGVSNFSIGQINHLIDNNCHPAIVQLEYSPFFQPNNLVDFCHQNGIIVMGYRPFAKGEIFRNSELIEKFGKNISGTVLNWISRKGIIPIISSDNETNIQMNSNYNSISLSKDNEDFLNSLDRGKMGSTCMTKYCDIN